MDKETLERVQKRFIRNLSDKKGGTYEERLESVGLTTLTERRERGDMIETFRTMNGSNKVNKDEWFQFRNTENTRATRSTVEIKDGEQQEQSHVLFKENVRLESRKQFFTVRMVSEWNRIPDEVKNQRSVNGFKDKFDEWKRQEKQKQQSRDNPTFSA